MRTAYEKRLTIPAASLKLFLAVCVFSLSTPVLADQPNAATSPMPVMSSTMPTLSRSATADNSAAAMPSPQAAPADLKSPSTLQVATAGATPDPQASRDGITISAPPPAMHSFQGIGDHKDGTSLNEMETKASDAAKDVIKNISSSSENMTLDDLNNAKMAVARIDALTELEKHLAEFEKARNEREGKSAPISAIPASALAPPPPPTIRTAIVNTKTPPPAAKTAATIEVLRISGSVGNNSAQLLINGQSKVVHVGDELSDGSLVTSISATDVTVRRDGVVHHLEMKGVDVIYGRTY